MTPDQPVDGGGDDVVITDRELYDQAIAPAAPEPSAQLPASPPAGEPAPQVQGGRQRDAQGRFVPQPAQPGAQPGQQPPPQQPQRAAQQPQHQVPLRELLDERERRQKLEAETTQLRNAWAQLEQAAAMQRQQQHPQQQTIFDAPDQYLAHNVINPLRQEGHMAMLQIKDGLSREMANQQFGEKAVQAALDEITKVRMTPQGDFAYRQMMASGHPYGALVRWHAQARAQQAIGNDPNAWLRARQQEWVRDPNAQKAVLEYLRQQQTQQGRGQPPNVQLPPSLSTLPGSPAGAEPIGDLSDASLYAFATAPPRR